MTETPFTHRLCAAPMMDWTDCHCRFFLRQVGRDGRGIRAGAMRAGAQTDRLRGGHYRPIVHIPAAIAANNQGLIGVRVSLGSRARKVEVPMGFERYGDLDPQELEIYLGNALVLMGVSGTISGESGVFQLPDAP